LFFKFSTVRKLKLGALYIVSTLEKNRQEPRRCTKNNSFSNFVFEYRHQTRRATCLLAWAFSKVRTINLKYIYYMFEKEEEDEYAHKLSIIIND
jgi:hypothetical protein